MRRTLPPSGTPIHFGELVDCVTSLGSKPDQALEHELRSRLGADAGFLFATGRGAMTFLLHCMKLENGGTSKRQVIIPSYTCYSVVASVLKAGLEVLVCDINPESLSLSEDQLSTVDFSRVLAVVNTSLYGIPGDMARLEQLVGDSGAYFIDDAAQSLGARFAGRPSGSFGDAGILSFDKGKVVTSINGGAIVSSNASLVRRMESEYRNISRPSAMDRTKDLAKLGAYCLMLRPSLYWLPSNLPFLKLGETRYDESYPVTRYFGALAPLVRAQLGRLEDMNRHRRHCAGAYSRALSGLDHVTTFTPCGDSEPNFLRYPVRIPDARVRDRFLSAFRTAGCSVSYPSSIADVDEVRNRVTIHNDTSAGGRAVAAEIVTLPTHAFVTDKDIAGITRGLTDCATAPVSAA